MHTAHRRCSMEKISRIIPANSRTATAEVATAQPARPGAPSMGRVEGKVTKAPLDIQDRVNLSGAEKVDELPPLYKKGKPEAAKAQVIDEMAKKFFDTNPVKSVRGEVPGSESAVAVAEAAEEVAPRQVVA